MQQAINQPIPQHPAVNNDPITAAARRWHIPVALLIGVWGMETNFGKDVNTSSAGAVGDFQFLPSTAKGYGYPLTNNPTAAQFAKQADSAAHYLHDLIHQHNGNVDQALKAYSGGGYGLSQVQAKAKGGGGAGGIPNPLDLVTKPLAWADALGKILTNLLDPKFWLRIGMVVGGFLLIYIGLRQLGAPGVGTVARKVL